MCIRRKLLIVLQKRPRYALIAHTRTVVSDSTEPEISEERSADHPYTSLVPWQTGKDLAKHLHDNALFESKHMLAVNKPNTLPRYSYRMPLQVSRADELPNVPVCLNDALPHLMQLTNAKYLNVTLGVHRNASGVVVLAKTETFHQKLQHFFKERVRKDKLFLQTFWAITHGVPVPESREDIRLGLKKQKIGDYVVTYLTRADHVSNRLQRLHQGQRPYMSYTTLVKSQATWPAALVQVQPTSTRWDSIEVLMASQLAPLLGDHVYSSRVGTIMDKRIAVKQTKCPPKIQDLPRQLLAQLGLGRKDALQVPQHLHHRQLIIPKIAGVHRDDIQITAPLPDYFQQTMKWLEIPEPGT